MNLIIYLTLILTFLVTFYSYETSSLPDAIADMDTVFPAFIIYDYGGKIRFRETLIEPWSKD